MRVVIDHLGKIWGQQTIQVNQPGSAVPEIQPNLPFDVNDFVPIGFLGEVPMAIAVSPALRVNSWPELIAYSKAVGGLNVAAPNRDGVPHLTAKLFRDRSAADVTPVYYPGSAQAINVISGRVPILIEGSAGPLAGGTTQAAWNRVTGRLASFPDIPTVAETLPGFAARKGRAWTSRGRFSWLRR
jgi:tripartite-type tricarboxylate transporter receptor subunit TctC